MVEIETERLKLRQFILDDLDELYNLYHNPKVMKYVGKGILTKPETEAKIFSIIKSWEKNNFGMWAVVHKRDHKMIGRCGFCFLDNTPEIELGYLLNPVYWYRGLATEAAKASLRYGFEQLKLEKIVAVAQPENIASRRVMEKVGMKYEKEANYYQSSVVYYTILSKENRSYS
ncbi:GNAT family N-acetyltransferase [Okeania sp. SIO1I7]|uniref:GNAT family N-acetyltransferase n=1 Tax=Okeania sp. SIO1I7 TaxID=2607772 RepID=UPI0013F96A2F|nr:GNAT family N-acetyltransferase [Okeania sp. SIO1I7]NET27379.1 GNAT family N-acetyltransferase [Okeania sp. SIO1I7]